MSRGGFALGGYARLTVEKNFDADARRTTIAAGSVGRIMHLDIATCDVSFPSIGIYRLRQDELEPVSAEAIASFRDPSLGGRFMAERAKLERENVGLHAIAVEAIRRLQSRSRFPAFRDLLAALDDPGNAPTSWPVPNPRAPRARKRT